MAAAAGDVFEEHLGVIAALKENYVRREDAMTVANINSLREEVTQLCRAREEEVKDVIRELTARSAAAEAQASYPSPEDAHERQVETLHDAAAEAREGVESLTAQLREMETQRVGVKAGLRQLEEKEAGLEKLVNQTEPRIRHKLSLYAHVAKIVWDFERPGSVAGILDDPSQDKLKSFDLGAEADFKAVNALWELIGGQ